MSEIFLSNVRLSFPALKEARSSAQGAAPKYGADFIMLETDAFYQQFMQTVGQMATEKWGEHAQQVLGMVGNDRKLRCFGRGSEKVNSKTFQVFDGYDGDGVVYISANRAADRPPQMIKPDGSPVDPLNTMEYQAVARTLYGGCRVNAVIKPWLQENKHGRGVRCDLLAVQFQSDDSAFGEGDSDVSGHFGQAAAPSAFGGSTANTEQAATTSAPGMPGFFG